METIKQIEELPEEKKLEAQSGEDAITKLPDWSIEPPLVIKRGEQ